MFAHVLHDLATYLQGFHSFPVRFPELPEWVYGGADLEHVVGRQVRGYKVFSHVGTDLLRAALGLVA